MCSDDECEALLKHDFLNLGYGATATSYFFPSNMTKKDQDSSEEQKTTVNTEPVCEIASKLSLIYTEQDMPISTSKLMEYTLELLSDETFQSEYVANQKFISLGGLFPFCSLMKNNEFSTLIQFLFASQFIFKIEHPPKNNLFNILECIHNLHVLKEIKRTQTNNTGNERIAATKAFIDQSVTHMHRLFENLNSFVSHFMIDTETTDPFIMILRIIAKIYEEDPKLEYKLFDTWIYMVKFCKFCKFYLRNYPNEK